jgi:hypothetical protein
MYVSVLYHSSLCGVYFPGTIYRHHMLIYAFLTYRAMLNQPARQWGMAQRRKGNSLTRGFLVWTDEQIVGVDQDGLL